MLVRPVMKRLFFPCKTKKKRLASLARLITIEVPGTLFFLKYYHEAGFTFKAAISATKRFVLMVTCKE